MRKERQIGIQVLGVAGFVARQEGRSRKDLFSRNGILHPGLQLAQNPVIAGVPQDGLDVHKVQGRQLIEVQHVRMEVVGGEDQVLHQPPVGTRRDAVGHLLGANRSDPVRHGANAADPLRNLLGIQGVCAPPGSFPARETSLPRTRRLDAKSALLAAAQRFRLGVHRKVPFDPRERADGYRTGHVLAPLQALTLNCPTMEPKCSESWAMSAPAFCVCAASSAVCRAF